MPVLTGAGTRVNVQWESTYKTLDGTASPFVPGANCRLATAQATNNGTRITLPASQVAVDIEEGTFDGAWALEGVLTNPWLFQSIYGAPSTVDNGDGTFTHTYSLGGPDSFHILEGYETSQNDERKLQGCVTARWACDPTVDAGEGTPWVAEGFYATESVVEATTLTSQDTLDEDPLDYGDATLSLGGAAESIVQNASLELAWDPIEPIQAFSSRFALDFVAGLFTPTVQYSKIKQDDASLTDTYGGSTSMQEDIENQSKFELDFDNGIAAGSGKNRILFEGSGDSFPESYDEDGPGNPRQAILENLNRLIENIDVKATNETSSPP